MSFNDISFTQKICLFSQIKIKNKIEGWIKKYPILMTYFPDPNFGILLSVLVCIIFIELIKIKKFVYLNLGKHNKMIFKDL